MSIRVKEEQTKNKEEIFTIYSDIIKAFVIYYKKDMIWVKIN